MLSREQILHAIETKAFEIGPNYDLNHVRNSSLDVALGEHWWYVVTDQGVQNPATSDPANWFRPKHGDSIVIPAGERILARTRVFVRCGPRITMKVKATSTCARSGLTMAVDAGHVDAGYCNPVTLEIYNLNPFPIEVMKGMVLAQLLVEEVQAPLRDYHREGGFYGSELTIEDAMAKWRPEMMLPRPVKFEDGSRLRCERDVEPARRVEQGTPFDEAFAKVEQIVQVNDVRECEQEVPYISRSLHENGVVLKVAYVDVDGDEVAFWRRTAQGADRFARRSVADFNTEFCPLEKA